jgi:hypothetical protein
MLKPFRLSAVALTIALACSTFVSAQVLQQIPDDAFVVIKANNPLAISERFAALSGKIGLANLHPALANPLAVLKQQLNIKQGLDEKGETAVVIFLPAPNDPQPRVLALVPVSDYTALLGNFAGVKKEGALDSFQLMEGGEPLYATQWGKYAAVTPFVDLLAKKPAGLAIQGAIAKQFQDKDITAYVNMRLVRDMVLPQLRQIKQFVQTMPMPNAPAQPQAAAFQRAMATQMFTLGEALFEQTQGVAASLSLADAGVTSTFTYQFEPNSNLGNFAQRMKGTDAPFLVGLPSDKYLLYGGWAGDLKDFGDWYAGVLKSVQLPDADAKALDQALTAYSKLWSNMRSMTFGLTAPNPANVRQTGLFQGFFLIKGDAKALLAAQKEILQYQDIMMKASGNAGIDVKFEIKPNAKTVAGISLDQYTMRMVADPQNAPDANILQILQFMYGEGITSYIGVINDNLLISAVNVDDARLQALITAAKQNQNPLADLPENKQAAQLLPKQRLGEFHVHVDNIVTTAFEIASAMGGPAPIKLPPDLPPLTITISTDDTAVRFDTHVPTDLLQNLVSIALQIGVRQGQR